MNERVIRNAIRYAHCGAEVDSRSVDDFRRHTCDAVQAARGSEAWTAVDLFSEAKPTGGVWLSSVDLTGELTTRRRSPDLRLNSLADDDTASVESGH